MCAPTHSLFHINMLVCVCVCVCMCEPLSRVRLFVTPWTVTVAARLFCPWGFARPECWSGLPWPPPGDPDPGIDPGLPHCRWILYRLSHQGSPRNLEWVAYPFSRGSSQPRNRTRISCIAGRFSTSWATREAKTCWNSHSISWPHSQVYSQRDSDINSQMLPDVSTHTFTYTFLKSRTCIIYMCTLACFHPPSSSDISSQKKFAHMYSHSHIISHKYAPTSSQLRTWHTLSHSHERNFNIVNR